MAVVNRSTVRKSSKPTRTPMTSAQARRYAASNRRSLGEHARRQAIAAGKPFYIYLVIRDGRQVDCITLHRLRRWSWWRLPSATMRKESRRINADHLKEPEATGDADDGMTSLVIGVERSCWHCRCPRRHVLSPKKRPFKRCIIRQGH